MMIGAFLDFLERDIREAPERLAPLSLTRIAEFRKLVVDTHVEDHDILPDNVTF